jgi:hypothetical protein
MWLAAAPWSNTTVLVPDSGNGRVLEVDVVNSTLVRVWASGIGQPRGVAASAAVIAVSQENATSSLVLVYSVASGALQVTIGGAPLAAGNSCCAGVQLGQPSGLRLSQDGATVDVAETGAGRVTRWRVELVPGLGMAVVLQVSSRLVLLSSVVMSSQLTNASLVEGSSTMLSVAVSGAASGVTYAWTRDGMLVDGNASSCVLVSNGSDAGAVYAIGCTATHALGRAVSSVAYVTVHAQVC